MSDLTAEEQRLLARAQPDPEPRRRPRREEPVEAPKDAGQPRGPLTTAQHDDDGWGDIPVQMRG